MKKKAFIRMVATTIFLLSFAMLSAQSCYEKYLASGTAYYQSGNYDAALKDFKAAKFCDGANLQILAGWINKSTNKINEIEKASAPVKERKIGSKAVDSKKSAEETINASQLYNFGDDFSSNVNRWSMGENDHEKISIENGKFSFETLADTRWTYKAFPIDLNRDFKVSLNCRWTAGIDNNGFGMLYTAGNGGQPNYLFAISANGSYIIRSYSDNSDMVNVTEWQTSAYINKYSLVNNLKITRSGGKLLFFINNTQVNSLPFDGGYGERFGFVIFGKQQIEFDDFKISGIKK